MLDSIKLAGGIFGIASSALARLEFIRSGRRRFRRLRAGTRSCGPGPPVYDSRGRGTPSHRLGRIHPYVRSCAATGPVPIGSGVTGGPESVRDAGMGGRKNSFDQLVFKCARYVAIIPIFRWREIIRCEQKNKWHWIDLARDDLRSCQFLFRVYRSHVSDWWAIRGNPRSATTF